MVEATKDPQQVMSDSYAALEKAIQDSDHQAVKKLTDEILSIDTSDKTACAIQAKFISLIRTRNFDEALQFANKQQRLKQENMVELAYILHR